MDSNFINYFVRFYTAKKVNDATSLAAFFAAALMKMYLKQSYFSVSGRDLDYYKLNNIKINLFRKEVSEDTNSLAACCLNIVSAHTTKFHKTNSGH